MLKQLDKFMNHLSHPSQVCTIRLELEAYIQSTYATENQANNDIPIPVVN